MSFRPLGLALIAVALAVPASGAGGISTPQTEVRATILHQASLFKQKRWRTLYQTMTPRLRAKCPYARFVPVQRENYSILGSNFQLRNIRVRAETGARAIAAYSFVKNGQALVRVTFSHRDVYVKVGSRWLDELDRVSGC